MKTAIQSDHIWDMLKRQSTVQLNHRCFQRTGMRRLVALSGRRRKQR